jgi:hypothetical protein
MQLPSYSPGVAGFRRDRVGAVAGGAGGASGGGGGGVGAGVHVSVSRLNRMAFREAVISSS